MPDRSLRENRGMNLNRAIDLVVIGIEFQRRRFISSGGDENGNNRNRMAGFVKILQVQSIIPHLIHCCAIKNVFANFELDHKHNWAEE